MKPKFTTRTLITAFLGFILTAILSGNDGTVQTITYHSTTQNATCSMNVYLPVGYDLESDTNHYPVFYLIHGGGENYTHWINSGEADKTLNSYIASGKCVPMILVMPDAKNLDPPVFHNELVNDIIPYIESHYRVKTDKDNRGVGGLSWGGLQAMESGIYHYEKFGYLSVLSSGWFASDNTAYTKARNFLDENGEDLEKSTRYIYFSEGTSTDIAYQNGLATLDLLRTAGLTVHYWEHFGGHTWLAWREDLKAFLPFLFRDSTTVYVSLEFQGGKITTSTIMTNIDSLAKKPANPTRVGYTFDDWYKEAECINKFDFTTDTIRKSITIYANWSINSYKVTFNSNGGSVVNDTLIAEYNTTIAAPAEPVKSDSVFAGWYTSQSLTKKWNFETDKVTNDITLYAKWIDPSALSTIGLELAKINFFPNPASDFIQIQNLPVKSLVSVYNSAGKLIVQKQSENNIETIRVNFLSNGLYLIDIKHKNVNYSQKILINR